MDEKMSENYFCSVLVIFRCWLAFSQNNRNEITVLKGRVFFRLGGISRKGFVVLAALGKTSVLAELVRGPGDKWITGIFFFFFSILYTLKLALFLF